VVERALLAALGALPASVVGRTRTLSRGATLVGRLGDLALRPLAGKPVAVRHGPARGLRMQAAPRSLAWLTGKVEPAVQRVLVEHVKRGQTVVDAGASVGFHTLLAARLVGPGGAVVAFEPSPADAAALRLNAGLNGFANVTVVEQALSQSEDEAYLDRPGEATATLLGAPAPGALGVTTTSLDAFLDRWDGDPPELVKIDVEGHEAAVLEGMRTTLRRVRPVLVLELHGDSGLVTALDDAGYSTRLLEPGRGGAPPRDAHVLAVPRGRR
jgi:FkbM family methyltransferase